MVVTIMHHLFYFVIDYNTHCERGGIRGYFRTESVVWQNQEEVAFSEEIPIHDMHYCLTW